MSQTIITAGDANSGLVQTAGNDGTLVLQSGAAGAKVNAVVYAADGGATFIKTTGGILTLGTSQATTSGTSIDFTGIPSWVKRITLMLYAVSTSGTSLKQIQLGAGSIITTGYSGSGSTTTTTVSASVSTTGILVGVGNTAADSMFGHMVITSLGSNLWIASSVGAFANGSGGTWAGAGGITLSGTLDRLRLTTVGGTDTFDAGSVNILYEG